MHECNTGHFRRWIAYSCNYLLAHICPKNSWASNCEISHFTFSESDNNESCCYWLLPEPVKEVLLLWSDIVSSKTRLVMSVSLISTYSSSPGKCVQLHGGVGVDVKAEREDRHRDRQWKRGTRVKWRRFRVTEEGKKERSRGYYRDTVVDEERGAECEEEEKAAG